MEEAMVPAAESAPVRAKWTPDEKKGSIKPAKNINFSKLRRSDGTGRTNKLRRRQDDTPDQHIH